MRIVFAPSLLVPKEPPANTGATESRYIDAIRDALKVALEKNERVVQIKGDTVLSYSAVMAVMDDLRKAGIEDIGLITEPKTPPNQQAGGK